MQKAIRIVLAFVVLVVLLSFTVCFTVRFTETAVVTTFGRADAGDVKDSAGLYFKWPYPIQSYTKYDTRTRLLRLRIETQQTADNRQVAVEAFCVWRVSDPLKFFQTFSNAGERSEEHFRKAEDALRANLRAATGVVSNYTMEDLFTTRDGRSKLPELEERMLAAFRAATDQQGSRLADYGVEAVQVGLTRIVLPQEVTRAVFDRMRSGRDRIAREIETRGQSQAQAIRDKAEADAKKIMAFAERLAQDTRQLGDLEAVPYLQQMNARPELAVFLQNMEWIRQINPRTTTLVVPSSMPGLGMMMPDALQGLRAGDVPRVLPPGVRDIIENLPGSDSPPASTTPSGPQASDVRGGTR